MARRDVEIRVVGDADSAVKAFRQVDDAGAQTQSKFKSVSSGVGSSASAAFAGVGVASVASLGAEMFKLGADLEQLDAKAKTVFGDQIGEVESWAKANANAMGLTASEAKGLATNMADLLIPMEFTRDQATSMSTEIIGLSGALSAWSGGTKSAAEVSEILTSAMLGETDGLKALGISISAAEIQAELLKKGQQDLTGTALQQAEAQAVMNLVMAKSTDAQTAFKDGVVSTNEQMAMQNAKFRELRENVGSFVHKELNEYANWAMSPSGKGVTGFWKDYNAGIDASVMFMQRWIDKTKGLRDLMERINTLNPAFQAAKGAAGFFGLKFHTGGVVPGGPSTEVPAILQGGETVLTAAQMARLGSGGGNSYIVNAPNYVGDKRDLVAALSDAYATGARITDGRGGVVRPD